MHIYKIEYRELKDEYEFITSAYNAKEIKETIEDNYTYKGVNRLHIYEISPKTGKRYSRNSWKYDFQDRKWRSC